MKAKKRDRVIKVASYAMQRLQAENDALRAAHERAVDAAVALEQEMAEMRRQRDELLKEKEQLIEWLKSLRYRIFTLRQSMEVDMDVFEGQKYGLADEDETVEVI